MWVINIWDKEGLMLPDYMKIYNGSCEDRCQGWVCVFMPVMRNNMGDSNSNKTVIKWF